MLESFCCRLYSPLCNFYYDLESPEHILLLCLKLQSLRSTLFRALFLHPPITYSAVRHAVVLTLPNLNYFITFPKLAFTYLLASGLFLLLSLVLSSGVKLSCYCDIAYSLVVHPTNQPIPTDGVFYSFDEDL